VRDKLYEQSHKKSKEKNMIQNQQAPPGYVLMFVPTAPATPPEEPKEEKTDYSVIGGIFWAIMLALAFWFVTGGWEQIGN
jgi:hypothetical protein